MSQKHKLIFSLSTAQHLLKNHMVNLYKQEGLEITPTHSTILFLLEKSGPMVMNELSEALHIENSTVTGLVDRLEKKGFVSREPVADDRRKLQIRINEDGLEELNRARSIIRAVNAEIGEGFTDKEIENFVRVLNSFFIKFPGKKRDSG